MDSLVDRKRSVLLENEILQLRHWCYHRAQQAEGNNSTWAYLNAQRVQVSSDSRNRWLLQVYWLMKLLTMNGVEFARLVAVLAVWLVTPAATAAAEAHRLCCLHRRQLPAGPLGQGRWPRAAQLLHAHQPACLRQLWQRPAGACWRGHAGRPRDRLHLTTQYCWHRWARSCPQSPPLPLLVQAQLGPAGRPQARAAPAPGAVAARQQMRWAAGAPGC